MIFDTLVSVIIPFFNRPDSTLNAIESVLNQSYKNIELIVVDDGSESSIEHETVFNDPRISLIKHANNLGANAARNSGYKKSKGDLIGFLDSDDTWEPNKVSIMVDALSKNEQFSVCYCGMNYKNGDKTISVSIPNRTGDIYIDLLPKNIVGSASVPLLRRVALEHVNGFDENLKSAQDWDLWLRIAKQGYNFFAIPQALVNYTIPTSGKHISNSEYSFWEGRKSFIQKHKSEYTGKNKQALGQIYSDIGFLLIHRFENRRMALKCFVKAIISKPTRVKSWKGLVATFLPKSLFTIKDRNLR